MPGWELDPNIAAAETLAFDFNFTGKQKQSFGQFPTIANDIKVQNFFVRGESVNLSIRFDITKYIEPA